MLVLLAVLQTAFAAGPAPGPGRGPGPGPGPALAAPFHHQEAPWEARCTLDRAASDDPRQALDRAMPPRGSGGPPGGGGPGGSSGGPPAGGGGPGGGAPGNGGPGGGAPGGAGGSSPPAGLPQAVQAGRVLDLHVAPGSIRVGLDGQEPVTLALGARWSRVRGPEGERIRMRASRSRSGLAVERDLGRVDVTDDFISLDAAGRLVVVRTVKASGVSDIALRNVYRCGGGSRPAEAPRHEGVKRPPQGAPPTGAPPEGGRRP